MIEINNVTKVYNATQKAIDNLTLKINDGEIFGFIGHNGAGKTTTIKSIVGILNFEKGDILINSKSIKNKPIECKKEIAYIQDNPDLYENLTGIEFINFIADIYEISKDERNKNIKKYSEIFEMESNLGDSISSYSHGMKQKIAIISALVHNPKVLILDEPFVGLDPKAVFSLKEIMREMCKQNNITVFFSTHILEVAEKLCDRVGIIQKGKIVKVGTVSEIKGDKTLENVFLNIQNNK